jgi:tetratricopeptide (TPR) repeat protein
MRFRLSILAFLVCASVHPSLAQQSVTDHSIRDAQTHVRVFPDDPAGYAQLGAAYLQKGRETNDASYYDLAKKSLERSLDLYAGDPLAAFPTTQMAVAMMTEHRFHDALDWGQRALGYGLGDPAPWAIIGDAYADLGQYDMAAEAYAKLVPATRPGQTPDPRRPLVYERDARMSYLRFIDGDTTGAIGLMQSAVRTAATDHLPAENIAWSLYQLGEEFFQAGDLPHAEDAQQQALAVYPTSYRALAGLAKVRVAQGRLQEAAELYERSLHVVPVAEYAANLGDVYAQLGKSKQAKKNYDLVEIIGYLSKLNQSLNNRELALYYADHDFKLAESLEFAKKELEVRQDVYSWDILAWAYYKNGKPAEAAEAMSHALGRGTKDALFLFHAGMICDKAGDSAKARDYLQRALDINPHFHILYSGTASETLARLAKKDVAVRHGEASGVH